MTDAQKANPKLSVTLLRYFNPIGAHESGIMGEDPKGIPNNLLPYIAQVAVGKLEKVHVFGNDYPTPDGTGVRDYIHVVDLAIGHVKAIEHCSDKEGVHIYNLGTGNGYSVLDIVKAFSKACGKEIPYQIDQEDRAILPNVMQILQRQRLNLAGRLREVLTKCALTAGDGSQLTLTVSVNN